MTTFGSDFGGVTDFDANWTFQTNETRVLQEAIARRLMCPSGGLFYDSRYGFDVRSLIADNVDPDYVARLIDAEVKKDERVSSSQTLVTVVGDTATIGVTCVASTGATFALTLSVNSLTVTLLNSGV